MAEGQKLIRSIGVLAYKGAGEQDVLAVWETLFSVKGAGLVKDLDVDTVALETDLESGHYTMQMGTKAIPNVTLKEKELKERSYKLYDLAYVPGGLGCGEAAKEKSWVLDWVRHHYNSGRVIGCNCTGIVILHRAGILGDTPVTAPPSLVHWLRKEGVNVVHPRRMWLGVPERRLWTSAGGSSVHASTVALVSHYFGRDVGREVGLLWDTFPHLGEGIFELKGPEYKSYPLDEKRIQNTFKQILIPGGGKP